MGAELSIQEECLNDIKYMNQEDHEWKVIIDKWNSLTPFCTEVKINYFVVYYV